jgi:lipoic acid synthetase
VARDDIADGGAEHFRQTIEAVRKLNPKTVIEVLVPDFQDSDESIEMVLAANPHIFNHNLETVRRLTPEVRHRATYDRSLSVLKKVKQHVAATRQSAANLLASEESGGLPTAATIFTKSGMMLGLGETEPEVMEAMRDLRAAGCDILTLGQYLQPSLKLLPVKEFVSPDKFAEYKAYAQEIGFVHVASGPMVRSSYHADEFNAPATGCSGVK